MMPDPALYVDGLLQSFEAMKAAVAINAKPEPKSTTAPKSTAAPAKTTKTRSVKGKA
jgi:hypothetical protein